MNSLNDIVTKNSILSRNNQELENKIKQLGTWRWFVCWNGKLSEVKGFKVWEKLNLSEKYEVRMSITKFEIYDYWKDKSITNNFKTKYYANCEEKDDAIRIIEFSDDICCWACGLPSLIIDGEKHIANDLKKEWNNDKSLQKSHILAKSLGGDKKAENMFLLCPICHADSPDTMNTEFFFAWIYYKRKNENYISILIKELEQKSKIKNIDFQIILDYLSNCDYNILMNLRKEIIKSCTVHGSFVSMSSKMMLLIDRIIKDIQ